MCGAAVAWALSKQGCLVWTGGGGTALWGRTFVLPADILN